MGQACERPCFLAEAVTLLLVLRNSHPSVKIQAILLRVTYSSLLSLTRKETLTTYSNLKL